MASPATAQENDIVIESSIISLLDTTGIIHIREVADFYNLMDLFHNHRYKPSGMTLTELARAEQAGAFSQELAQKILRAVTQKMLTLAEPHLKDLRRIKDQLEKIIIQWAKQRNKPDSPLLMWSSIDANKEKEFFQEHVTSLAHMDIFLQDLICFINDFMHSCPKSYNRYLEYKKIVEENKQ